MICDARLTLRNVFNNYYFPAHLEDPASRNWENYRCAINRWESITDDPPVHEITTRTLADFKAGLFRYRDGRLSPARIRSLMQHVQYVLDFAGPRGSGRRRDVAGLLEEPPPYLKPPRAERHEPPAASLDQLNRLYDACGHARLPHVEGTAPPALWRALVSTAWCTTLRIGQLVRLAFAMVDVEGQRLVLPPGICRKSKAEEIHDLSDQALADIEASRSDRELVFPFYRPAGAHSPTTIYAELRRLCRIAGVDYFTWHPVRRRAATELSAISPAAAQRACGHSLYSTTQLYQSQDLLTRCVRALPAIGKSEN